MKNDSNIKQNITISMKIVVMTMFICSILYPVTLFLIANAVVPFQARGSLIHNQNGELIGSKLIGQSFSSAEYFWPRQSANKYNAANSGGSNLSPTNPKLRVNTELAIKQLAIKDDVLIPTDLVTASGSGLDPHISWDAALIQIPRIAEARRLPNSKIESLISNKFEKTKSSFYPNGIINVLELNLALDSLHGHHE